MSKNEQAIDIYHPSRKLSFERELIRLRESQLSQRNKDLISRYHSYKFATGAQGITVAKRSCQLRELAARLQKDLDMADKDDIEALVGTVNRSTGWRDQTKADYRRSLKEFYSWFEDNDLRLQSSDEQVRSEAQRFYKYVKTKISIATQRMEINYSDIITEKDIATVTEIGTNSIKEKAAVFSLHELGARAGEFLGMQIKDVEYNGNFATVRLTGKTGQRRVAIVRSLPYLSMWLSVHPFRKNPDSRVWISDRPNKRYLPLKHRGLQELVNRCFKRAGITKKHNLHWFRHSSATINAARMSDSIMCKYYGWVGGSKQVGTYVHLNPKQVEDAVLSMHGLKASDSDTTVRACGCGAPNAIDAMYCFRCGKPMDVNVIEQEKQAHEDGYKELVRILSNPDIAPKFQKFLQEMMEREKT